MRFLLDTNIPYSSLKVFNELILEAVHAKDVGLSKATDEEIMNYSIKNKCIIVTKDLGFANIRNFPAEPQYGAIVLRLPSFFKASQFAAALHDFLTSVNIEDLTKSVVIVKVGSYRIRKIK